MYYFYVLQSQKKKDWFYKGSTPDLKKRIEKHNAGQVSATKPYQPLNLSISSEENTVCAVLSQDSETTEDEKCPRCGTPYEDYRGFRMLCAQCNPEQHRSAHKAAIDASHSCHPRSVSNK